MFCTHCGNPVPNNAYHCPHCGAQVYRQNVYTPNPVNPHYQPPAPAIVPVVNPIKKLSVAPAKDGTVLAAGLGLMTLASLFGPVVSMPLLQAFTGQGEFTMLGLLSEAHQAAGYGMSGSDANELATITLTGVFWAIMIFVMCLGIYQALTNKEKGKTVAIGAVITGMATSAVWCLIIKAVDSSIASEFGSSYYYLSSGTAFVSPGAGAVLVLVIGAVTLGAHLILNRKE